MCKIKYETLYSNPFRLLIGKRPSKYRLLETAVLQTDIVGYDINSEFYRLYPTGILIAYAGCEWDGATGGYDTKAFMRGSLFHDILCYMIGDNALSAHYQPYADELLRDLCIEDGMSSFRANYIYISVRGFQSVSRKVQQITGKIDDKPFQYTCQS